MKIVGIIVEYNPFHNGHLFHLKETLKLSKKDVLICIVSGNFVQRGEPSIIDKYTKAKIALEMGVDLVIELPFLIVNQSAENFALGAVNILNNLGVNEIYFGLEDDIKDINLLVEKLDTTEVKSNLNKYLKEGYSYPKALELSLNSNILKPNNILGIEYVKAIKKLNCSIKPNYIKRKITNHNDKKVNNSSVQSATTIRQLIRDNTNINKYIPNNYLDNEVFNFIENYNDEIIHVLRTTNVKVLRDINLVSEGLENSLVKLAKEYDDINEIINKLTNKRYTSSRIKRVLMNILLGIKKIDFNEVLSSKYAKVLGFNSIGQEYLSKIKDDILLITKNKEGINFINDIDIKTSLVYSKVNKTSYKNDFNKPIIKK